MEQSVSFRVKTEDGKWDAIPLTKFAGRRVEDVFLELEGQEAVSEVIVVADDGREWKGYLCGTEKWVEYYQKKGFSAKGFKEGVEALRAKGSPLLNELCAPVEMVEEVFSGASVEEVVAERGLF